MVFENGWAYAVVTPVSKEGVGILGDTSKIVPLARERFCTAADSAETHVTVAYAPGETSVLLAGYAARRPTLRAVRGSIDSMQYAAATHLFSVTVHPAPASAGARTAELVLHEER